MTVSIWFDLVRGRLAELDHEAFAHDEE